MNDIEARRYRIIDLLGEGGFGKVYRARLEGAAGFYKDVALKLLHDEDVPEDTLQRFRDEARILGLIRDRAIVTVDPPSRLGGKWAVVMEYVEGASCAALVEVEVLPPSIALEIIQEVCRALDKVYTQKGPDGGQLLLIHRDLKPENIQITRSGEVKVLDFGIARAAFANREAKTTNNIGGTFGYIAPERLEGLDGPEGDVYSLGVVLHVLVTGERPTKKNEAAARELTKKVPNLYQVLELSAQMREAEPDQRPTARNLEERCGQLRQRMRAKSLRAWAEEHVPQAISKQEDDMVGTVLTETLRSLPSTTKALEDLEALESRRGGGASFGVIALLTAVIVALLVLLVATFASVAGGLGWWMGQEPTGPQIVEVEVPVPAPVAPAPVPVEPTVVEAPEEPAVDDEAAVVAPASVVPKSAPKPVVQPAQPAPVATAAPAPAGPILPISFSSVPMGARIYVDGVPVGTTPMMGHGLSTGKHTIVMKQGTFSGSRKITVGRRAPTRYIWKGGDQWEVHY